MEMQAWHGYHCKATYKLFDQIEIEVPQVLLTERFPGMLRGSLHQGKQVSTASGFATLAAALDYLYNCDLFWVRTAKGERIHYPEVEEAKDSELSELKSAFEQLHGEFGNWLTTEQAEPTAEVRLFNRRGGETLATLQEAVQAMAQQGAFYRGGIQAMLQQHGYCFKPFDLLLDYYVRPRPLAGTDH